MQEAPKQWEELIQSWHKGYDYYTKEWEEIGIKWEETNLVRYYQDYFRLIPMVRAMMKYPVLHPFYPFTSHAYLRLADSPVTGAKSPKISDITVEALTEDRFRAFLYDWSAPGYKTTTLVEGTTEEVAKYVADFVAHELKKKSHIEQ